MYQTDFFQKVKIITLNDEMLGISFRLRKIIKIISFTLTVNRLKIPIKIKIVRMDFFFKPHLVQAFKILHIKTQVESKRVKKT